jgi:hypothetical protein
VNFEQAYLGQQLMAHMEMVDKLEVLKNHAGPQLRAELDKSQQMAQSHLEEVRKLMDQKKDSETPRTARAPGEEPGLRPDRAPAPAPRATPPREE